METVTGMINWTDKEFDFLPPPEAPVFTPEPEEFNDPLSYIRKIRPAAEKFGVCRIVPPAKWRPPFSVDVNKFTFNPRVQRLKELEATTRVKLFFLRELCEFWEYQGIPLKIPVVEKRVLDFFTLNKVVKEEGGFRSACSKKKWSKIALTMGFPVVHGITLKMHYKRIINPYLLCVANKKKYSRQNRRSFTCNAITQSLQGDEDSQSFSKEIISYWEGQNIFQLPLIDNKPIDLKALYLTVRDEEEDAINWEKVANELSYPDGTSDQLKKCYMTVIKPYLENIEEDAKAKECDICKTGIDEAPLLACSDCGFSYHALCLTPPVTQTHKGGWKCYSCTLNRMDAPRAPYGFDQSERDYTLEEFGEMAVQFKQEHFRMPALDVPSHVVEKEYWRLLSSFDEDVIVEYGADVHSQDHGMGFPTKRHTHTDETGVEEYVESEWNLNNIPVIASSAYSHIGTNIPGVTIPWMYVGMCFSTFCWHTEDHWSYSINYLHWGEPKTWYSIPREKADAFESVLKNVAPELFKDQPDLLHDLSTTLNPNTLMNFDIPIYRTDQKAGEFVVTFPRAYHAGFNQGFNFAEAVNFAPADWIPIGRLCIDYYANLYHSCVFSHDELVCKMAHMVNDLDKTLAKATVEDLAVIFKLESALRKLVNGMGVEKCERVIFENIPDDSRQCCSCKTTCFLSAVHCDKQNILICLKDFSKINMFCSCPHSEHCFKYRYDLKELLHLIQNLHNKLK